MVNKSDKSVVFCAPLLFCFLLFLSVRPLQVLDPCGQGVSKESVTCTLEGGTSVHM